MLKKKKKGDAPYVHIWPLEVAKRSGSAFFILEKSYVIFFSLKNTPYKSR
jgi:hypothetical protein